jgi:hypothetical protein
MSFEPLAVAELAPATPEERTPTRGQVLLEELLGVHARFAALAARLDKANANIDEAAPRLGAVPSSQTFPGVAEVTSFFTGARALIALLNAEEERMQKMVEWLENSF